MELKRLRYFLAVAEELHFGRAAERLDMAQPPLSRQIAALEKDLEVKLFDRSRSQIRLTQAGAALQVRVRDLLANLDRSYREVRSIGQGGAGRLRIAFVGSATYGPLPSLIKSFRSHYPDVELALSAMNNADQKRALIQKEIDIAVARPSLDDDEFRVATLHSEPLIMALPDDSVLAQHGAVPLKTLKDQTLILYPRRPRPSFADHVLGILQTDGIVPADIIEAQDYQTAISLVSVGVGISIVPQSVSQGDRAGVLYRKYIGPNPGTSLAVHARLDNRAPHVNNFFDIVQKYARKSGLRR